MQLLSRFDPEWHQRFQSFLKAHPDLSERVSSCYAVRNSVAHGGTMNIAGQRLREYFEVGKRLVDGVINATNG